MLRVIYRLIVPVRNIKKVKVPPILRFSVSLSIVKMVSCILQSMPYFILLYHYIRHIDSYIKQQNFVIR